MVVSLTEQDGIAPIAPLLVQPIAPAEVAAILADVAIGAGQHRHLDVASPDIQTSSTLPAARLPQEGAWCGLFRPGTGRSVSRWPAASFCRPGRADHADYLRRVVGRGCQLVP